MLSPVGGSVGTGSDDQGDDDSGFGIFVADAPVSEESVIAAAPLSPGVTLSTIVSPAVSAPDKRQNSSSLPSNSVQAAPNDAIATAAAAPATTATTATTARTNYPGSLSLLPRSRKKWHTARIGPIAAGTLLTRGAGRMLITGAGAATATNDQVQAGEHAPPVRRRLTRSLWRSGRSSRFPLFSVGLPVQPTVGPSLCKATVKAD